LSHQAKIFNLFFSTKKSSGFGLWSARRYARANGGELTLKSQPGEGSTFVLCLPMPKEHTIKTPCRILIVDDEENWRRILCGTFHGAGFHADAAGTITEAWKLLTENDYQLAILDISMSAGTWNDEEGMQLLAQLDERGFLTTMKVMMLSGYGSEEQMRRAFRKHRVTDFMSKDDFFDKQEDFLDKVKQIVGDIQADA
jgi:CheY-like chemotaxis protein